MISDAPITTVSARGRNNYSSNDNDEVVRITIPIALFDRSNRLEKTSDGVVKTPGKVGEWSVNGWVEGKNEFGEPVQRLERTCPRNEDPHGRDVVVAKTDNRRNYPHLLGRGSFSVGTLITVAKGSPLLTDSIDEAGKKKNN